MIGFLIGLAFISVAEYCIHRWAMHCRGWFYQIDPRFYYDHAIMHHGVYYHQFNYEPDPIGRRLNLEISYWWGLIAAFPCVGLAWWLRSVEPLAFLSVIPIHAVTWNQVHAEMHDPSGRFFAQWPVFRFLCRYHYLHHRHTNRNFNAILPLGLDWLMGTLARATPEDHAEMRRIGIID